LKRVPEWNSGAVPSFPEALSWSDAPPGAIGRAVPALLIAIAAASAATPDPIYKALRESTIADSLVVVNIVLHRDAAVITLKSGTIGFTAPAMGRDTIAVFQGEGQFALTPVQPIEKNYLKSLTAEDTVAEPFDRALLVFTDDAGKEIRSQSKTPRPEPKLADVLRDYRKRLRNLDFRNIDAEILADLYSAGHPGFFSAYMRGRKHSDLRFHVNPRGAMPSLGPEEVALINTMPENVPDEVWYLSHLQSEIAAGKGASDENKRAFQAESYKIETTVSKSDHFAGVENLKFHAATPGERVIPLGLVPSLRVSKVVVDGQDAAFIQEDKKEDGAFYVILPQPVDTGSAHELAIEYQGDKVVHKAGGGNFSVGARESWYAALNSFHDYAKYDLIFKVPKLYTLVSVGKLVRQWSEHDFACSEWTSPSPLAVAGFNYGTFKKKAVTDGPTGIVIEGYAASEVPDYLRGAADSDFGGGMAPSRLIDQSLADAQNAVRLYTSWFGKPWFDRIAITQQPEFSFGQSWPTLVYLPMSAYLDATQRWQLMGINRGMDQFIEEVTPHEIAHQWWGHMVGDATYHDRWLSEGFADFSAALFLQITNKTPDRFNQFWEHARQRILAKNNFGRHPNDAGPISLGFRLTTEKNAGAYSTIVYNKGAFVLHMLRQMMFDNNNPKDGDKPFISMMQDFVAQHLSRDATTESFQRIVEKHMTQAMNLSGNGKLDWFFSQWVYGTSIPKYKLDYTVTPADDGKFLLKGSLTQSEVPDNFMMLVPIYLDLEGPPVRIGSARLVGSSSLPIQLLLPKKPKRVLINAYHDVLEQ
jgi:hypothetical protein